MRKPVLVLGAAAVFFVVVSEAARASDGFAPSMYGVTDVSIENVKFNDPKASDKCGLTKDGIATVLKSAFVDKQVPVVVASTTRMQVMGTARIKLIPEISTHLDEIMGCLSWVTLSAQSRENLQIPPIAPPREVTVLYWNHAARVFSGISAHPAKVAEVLNNAAGQFSQQFVADQRIKYHVQ
ncbi:MAG: hypothetical protein PHW76_08915 [Alphaproteobacteria bacterium]|nr:hypothetical protein [Alphaproteobacteria bacterium]